MNPQYPGPPGAPRERWSWADTCVALSIAAAVMAVLFAVKCILEYAAITWRQ